MRYKAELDGKEIDIEVDEKRATVCVKGSPQVCQELPPDIVKDVIEEIWHRGGKVRREE